MNKKLLLIPFLLLLFLVPVLGDVEYNFLSSSQIINSPTNNSFVIIGNYNNSLLIYGDVNKTARSINLSNNQDIGIVTGLPKNAICNVTYTSQTRNNTFYKLPNNMSVCDTGSSISVFDTNGIVINIAYSFDVNEVKGITSFNNSYYFYSIATNNIFTKKNSALGGFPSLNCYSQLSTVFLNNFGINTTATPIYSHSSMGTLIQHNFTTFYFKVGNRWFYFEETGSNDCTVIAETLNEATLNLPSDITSTDNRYIIINDNLYVLSKDYGTSMYILTSQEVDIYSGLSCNNDNSYCVNKTSFCVPPILGIGLIYHCNDAYPTSTATSQNGVYCGNNGDLVYCSTSCLNSQKTNSYGVTYYEGTCLNEGNCSNECNNLGERYSDTSNSYKQCTLNTDTGCLIYSGSVTCANGESSINGECINTTYTGGIGTLTGWNTKPFWIGDNIKYDSLVETGSLPSINLKSNSDNIPLLFYTSVTNKPYFNSRVCDYTNTIIYDTRVLNTVLNSTNNTIQIIPSGYTNGLTDLEILPDTDTGVLLLGTDSINREIYRYYITRNSSLGLCVYQATSSNNVSVPLGCINLYSDILINLKVNIQTLDKSNTIKLEAYQSPSIKYVYYGTFINKIDTDASTFSKLTLSMYGVLTSVIISNDLQDSQINLKQVNITDDSYTNPCLLTTVGCKTIRSYYMNYDASNRNFYNYKDWKVCVTALGSNVLISEGDGLLSGLSKQEKIIFAFVVSLIIALIFIITGLMSTDSYGKALVWIGMFSFIGGLIIFSIVGFFPIWILIVCGLIASIGIGLFFLNKSTGD